jgi:hypothetical protein
MTRSQNAEMAASSIIVSVTNILSNEPPMYLFSTDDVS